MPAAPGAVTGHHDVDRGVEDGLDLQPVERAGPPAGQVRRELVTALARQGRDPFPPRPVGDHDEVPRLGEAHGRRLVRRREHPAEHVGGYRVGAEAAADVPALRDDPVHGLALLRREAGIAHHAACGLGVVVRVVVRMLGLADAALEAGHRDPVHAHIAVHPDVSGQRLVVPLVHQGGNLVAVTEYIGAPDVQFGVRGGELGGLVCHPVGQHAGEQEVPGHHDLPCAEQAAPLQGRGARWAWPAR